MKKQLLFAAMAVLFVACSSHDVYDPGVSEAEAKQNFEKNFVAKYGAISTNQSWDLTSGGKLVTRAGSGEVSFQPVAGLNYGNPRAVATGSGHNTGYTVQLDKNVALAQSIFKALPNGGMHNGKKIVLATPCSSFTIYPVCAQGTLRYDLFVKVGTNTPQKLFSKTWTDNKVPYYNAMKTLDNHTVSMPGLMVTAPLGTSIEFYLNVYDNKTTVGTGSGNALYVNVPDHAQPEGITIKKDAEIKYLGFEDMANGGDHDYNDLVLCIVGNPDVPAPEDLTTDTYTVETNTTKRYMIEDLGATDDFDFNDIVVDVTDNTVVTHTVTLEDSIITKDVITNTVSKQKAIIRHLGGTLPFQLTIGNKQFDEMEGQMEVNPNSEYDITGWVPDENNINVKVKHQSGAVYTVTFPKKGTAPMIIAVDPSQEWMKERQSIPSSWWTKVDEP